MYILYRYLILKQDIKCKEILIIKCKEILIYLNIFLHLFRQLNQFFTIESHFFSIIDSHFKLLNFNYLI